MVKLQKNVRILAIESSCDETAAAVILGNLHSKQPEFNLLSSVVKSQISLHKKMGGVVPEVAARAHVQNILPVTQKALADSELSLAELDYIAVTSGPGLIASLLVGVEFAKGLSFALGKPMIPVNHMEGHLYSAFATVDSKQLTVNKIFPLLALIVSGGHTMLVLMKNYKDYKVIGSTVDDAAGEAFDKVARLLGLPYPGGPEISKLALQGKPIINFPRPMLNSKNYDFSFSGLKTAVRNFAIEQHLIVPSPGEGRAREGSNHSKPGKQIKADIAASFQEAAVDVLVQKAMRACKEFKCKTVSLSGGVAANKKLREALTARCKLSSVNFILPEFELCTDNAGMIALAAYFKLRNGTKPVSYKKVKADSTWEI